MKPQRNRQEVGKIPFDRLFGEGSQFISVIAVFAILVREALGAAIRFYASKVGAEILWFAPDVLISFSLVLVAITTISQRRISAVISIYLFFVAAITGYVVTGSFQAVIAAYKMFSITVVAAHIDWWRLNTKRVQIILQFVLITAVTGVVLNSYITFAWTGEGYTSFGVDREFTRVWWIDGQPRLSGFGSVSASSGFAILSLTIFCSINQRALLFAVSTAFSAYAIYLTTSRTALYTLIALSGLLLFLEFFIRDSARRMNILSGIARLSVFACVVTPFVSMALIFALDLTSVSGGYFTSLLDRAINTWAGVFENLYSLSNFGALFGVGFGAVGYPMTLYGNLGNFYNSADNIFLIFLSTFGLFSIPIFVLGGTLSNGKCGWHSILAVLLASIFGTTIAGFGDSWYMAVLGIGWSPLVVRSRIQYNELLRRDMVSKTSIWVD